MPYEAPELVDWTVFSRARAELGAAFVRILSYFREDGAKAVTAIEAAIAERSSAKLVLPAHTLKGEARQFGAEPLAALAEHVETIARRCVEARQSPDELADRIVELRPLFEATLRLFDREASPVVERRAPVAAGGFGRRAAPAAFGLAKR